MTEEQECPIVLIRDVPARKTHESPVAFVSEPGVSQQEYEEMVWNRR